MYSTNIWLAGLLLLRTLIHAAPLPFPDVDTGIEILDLLGDDFYDALDVRDTSTLDATLDFLPADIHELEKRHPVHCKAGVRVFAVRGSGSPLKTGAVANLAREIAGLEKDSRAGSLPYPALKASGFAYQGSVQAGVTMLTNRIQRYVDACPHRKIVVVGYSQGAQVVSDTLIGPSGTTGKGLAPKYRDNIAAAITMGDPTFVARQHWDMGSAQRNGVAARNNFHLYKDYGDRFRSYCTNNDYVCASGNSVTVHQSYFTQYGKSSLDFVKNKLHAHK